MTHDDDEKRPRFRDIGPHGGRIVPIPVPPAPRPSMLLAALAYARLGWRVFPLRPQDKAPLPELVGWPEKASRDPERIRAWWSEHPTANIGIACGAGTGLDVLDIDGEGGAIALAALEDEHGPIPATFEVRTARGAHLYFLADERVTNTAGKIAPGIDTRGAGGYVVAPPSVHPDGSLYRWAEGRAPRDVEQAASWPAWVPAWFERRAAAPETPPPETPRVDEDERERRYAAAALEREAGELADVAQGGRNDALNRAAFNLGTLVGAGLLSEGEVLEALRAACKRNGLLEDDGERQFKKTCASGIASGRQHPRRLPESTHRPRALGRPATAPHDLDAPLPDGPGDYDAAAHGGGPPPTPPRRRLDIRAVLDRWEAEGRLVHVRTGLERLDELTGGGPVYGSRWFVQGAPNAGKTALVVDVCTRFAERGDAVGLLAVDEEPTDMVTRIAQRARWSRQACELRAPHEIAAMRDELGPLPIVFYDAGWTIEAAAQDLAAYAKERGSRAVLGIDSVQTVICDEELGGELGMAEAVTKRTRAIRAVATEHRLLAIATSEMSRSAYSGRKGEGVSDMAAAKWSGAVEYSARVLLTLRSVPEESNLVELAVTKNKYGPDGEKLFLRLDRPRQRVEIVDYTPPTKTEARAEVDDEKAHEKAEELADKIVQELSRRTAKGIQITSRKDLERLVKGTQAHRNRAVSLLVTEGRIEKRGRDGYHPAGVTEGGP